MRTGVTIQYVEQVDKETIDIVYLHKEKKYSIQTKFLFHALGRRPATDGLNLEEIVWK